jgi:hypothetical protein
MKDQTTLFVNLIYIPDIKTDIRVEQLFQFNFQAQLQILVIKWTSQPGLECH